MDYFKLIDAYLNGDLTGSELSDFLRELKRNPNLAHEVELHKKANDPQKFQNKKTENKKESAS